MKIWSVSCTLAVLLLVAAAQRRGSRRFDLAQTSESPAEEEEELPLTRSHRFEGRRQSLDSDSSGRAPSRSRSGVREGEDQTDSRRIGTRQRETFIDNSSVRQPTDNRRGKGLTFKSRSELEVPDNDRILNTDTRRRSNKEERRTSLPSRSHVDISNQFLESGTVRSRSSSSRFSNKENIRLRNENNDASRNSPNIERRPLLPITSISPEDVTFPSRSRSRQTLPPEESFTTDPKESSRNLHRTQLGSTKYRSRTSYSEQTLPSRTKVSDSSSTKGSTRSHGAEIDSVSGTLPTSRTRADFSSLRRKPSTDLSGQDVESKLFSRRRNLTGGKTKPSDSDITSSKTVFPSNDEVKSTSVTIGRSTEQSPLLSSNVETNNAGREEIIDSEILGNKQIENGVDAIPTASNDALTFLPNEVLQSTIDLADNSDKLRSQDETARNDEDGRLTEALHARSRSKVTATPSEDDSKHFSTGRTRQRGKASNVESYRFTNRGKITTPEPVLDVSVITDRYKQRSRSNSLSSRQSVTEENVQDAVRNFRTKTRDRFPSRMSSNSRETAGTSTESIAPSILTSSRGRDSSDTSSSSQTDSFPSRTPARSGNRGTLPKVSIDSEATAKPFRGRGQVKQGKLNDNEKGSGRGKDEEVSEDDNYPEVYKQLKKAGNGPKEILALLMAKKKQREAQQALRRQQQDGASSETSTTASFLSDLKTEEDNIKPSIESSVRRKSPGKTEKEGEVIQPQRSSSRSVNRQRSLLFRNNQETDNFGQDNEESSTKAFQSETENRYRKQNEERRKKYSAKLRESNLNKDLEERSETKSEKPILGKNNYFKTLNDLGLDPKTLGPTEPTTERERFIPSSRRTKSYRASTEEINEESQNTSTFKPRYQLYQAKNRKKYLDKKFGGGKENLGSKEETDYNESVLEEEGDQRTKKLRFGAASRPPYTPPRRTSTPHPSLRPSPRRPGRYTPSSIAFERPEDQEPVTVQIFELEARAPKLESASLVTESSSSVSSSSTESSSTEGSFDDSSSESSDSVDSSSTESPLDNSVIDDEPVIPLPNSSPPTITSTTTTTTSTTSPRPTSTTRKPTTTKKPAPKITQKPTTTTKLPTTTSTTPKPTTTTTQKPTTTTTTTTTTPKPTTTTTTTPKPTTTTTTTPKPTTTTTRKPTTTTTTTPKPTTTTTQKPTTTTTQKPTTTTTQKPTTTTTPKSTTTTTPKPTKTTTTTRKPSTTKKPNTTKKPPSVPKAPQQQKPLTSSTTSTTTTTEPTTTAIDQLAARSNLIQRAEVSTVPEMIITSAQTFQPSTFGNIPRSTERPQAEVSPDYIAYALLPNNTLVRRVTARSTTPPTEVPFFVYGLFPNGTIVRKYPNGTVVPDEPSPESNELVAEVDPFNRKELSDILERDRPLAYLYPTTSTSTTLASTSKPSTAAVSTTLSTSTLSTTTSTTTTMKPTTSKNPPTTTTRKPNTTPKPKPTTKAYVTTQKPSITMSTSKTTSRILSTTTSPQPTTTSTVKPKSAPTTTTLKPTTSTTPKPTTTTPKPTTTTPKPTPTTTKPTTTTPKQTTTTPKPTPTTKPTTTTSKPTTTQKPSTTPKPTTTTTLTPKPSTTTTKPTLGTTKKPTPKQPTTTKSSTTTSTITTTIEPSLSTQTTNNNILESIFRNGAEATLTPPETVTPKDDEDCDICDDDISSPSGPSSKDAPSNGLSDDDFALLNNLLRLQPSSSERSTAVSSPFPPSGPEDDDIANRIIQLAIERAQSTTASPVSTEGLDLQQLSSSPEPNFEREGKSIAPPPGDSMAVETSPSPKSGGKISLWVVPDGESEQTTKSPQKLTPEDEQVLTALLAAPQSTSTISVRDQLLLAELLAAGQNNNQGIQISTTKRPRKKKRPTSTAPPPPPPTLNPLAALFGAGGRGGGLFGSGAVPPPAGSDEEGDPSGRPQQGGLLVNAAINITRAVSQFMGLVLQSAAQSFQSFLASRTRNFADYVARGGAIS